MATTKTVTRYRSRPKKKRRRKAGFTLPISIIAPLAMQGVKFVENTTNHGLSDATKVLVKDFTGYQPDPNYDAFKFNRMKEGLLPLLVGVAVHKVAGRLGLNRALGRAGVPIIRI